MERYPLRIKELRSTVLSVGSGCRFQRNSCHKIPPAMAPIPKRTINPPSIPCKPASTFPLILPRKRQVSHARKTHQLPVPPASPGKRQHPCPRVTPPKIPKEAKAVTNARIAAGFVTAIKRADKNRREYLPGNVSARPSGRTALFGASKACRVSPSSTMLPFSIKIVRVETIPFSIINSQSHAILQSGDC